MAPSILGDRGTRRYHRSPPAPIHHGPGAFPPEPFRYNAMPPLARFQEGRGSFSPSADVGAPSANGGRGSSRASSHSAAFHSHNGGREPTQGLDHGAAIYPDPQHRRPPRPSETSRRPAASTPPSHWEPSRVSSSASSDRHTASSKASSRVSSRAPSHTFSNTHTVSSASSPLDGTRAVSHAAFDETIATSVSSARRHSRATSQASVYSANMRPSGPSIRHIIQAPAKGPTSGNFQSPAATAGEAALIRAAVATSSRLSFPGDKQFPKPSQSGSSRVPSVVSVDEPDSTLSIPLNRPRSPYATSHQLAFDSGLHYQNRPRGSKDGFLGARVQERLQSHQGSQASSGASNERSARPPLPSRTAEAMAQASHLRQPTTTFQQVVSPIALVNAVVDEPRPINPAAHPPRPRTRRRQPWVAVSEPQAVSPTILQRLEARTIRSRRLAVDVLQVVAPITPQLGLRRAKSRQVDLKPRERQIAVSHQVMKVTLRAYQVGIRMEDVGLRSGKTVKVLPGKWSAVIENDL